MLKQQVFQELTGKEYIMADVACMYDKAYEKKHWNERIEFFKQMDFSDPDLFKNASNPIGLRAATLAMNDAANGVPSGYMISLDAPSSGLQLLSLLVSCPISWKLCGGDVNILDAYTEIFMNMDTDLMLNRDEVKKSIMTALYGSESVPKHTFGENIETFYETLEYMTPGAWDLNLGLQELWDEVEGNTYDWVMPDNFYACIETSDKERKKFTFLEKEFEVIQEVQERPRFHRGLGPNVVHSVDGLIVREMFRRCQFNPKVTTRVIDLIIKGVDGTDGKSADMVKTLWSHYEETGFLSARILDYLYEDTIGLVDQLEIAKLISSFPEESFQLVTIHDCFRCHPNYGNDVRKQYNQILADINDSHILPFICSQIANKKVKANKKGTIPRDVILQANYTLS